MKNRLLMFGKANAKRVAIALVAVIMLGVVGAFASSNRNTTFNRIGAGLTDNGASGQPIVVPPPGTGGGTATAKSASGSEAGSNAAKSWDRMVIRTATLQLTVKDVGTGVDRIRSLASQHGGYVSSSESRQEGEYTYSTVTIQVPSAEFDQIMPTLKKMEGLVLKVQNETISSSDVTEEYTDLQSQLRNLQATEVRMLALQAKAEQIEDVLAIDRELRAVQGEIETIQGRINYLSKRSEMSTITLQLSPEFAPVIQTPISEPAWQPFRAAENAWNASMDMLAGVGTAVIVGAIFFWWMLPIVLVGLILLARSRRRQPNGATSVQA